MGTRRYDMIEPSSDVICNWAWLKISGHHSFFLIKSFKLTWIGLAQLGGMGWAGIVGVLGHIWLFVLIRDEYISKRSYNNSHNSIFYCFMHCLSCFVKYVFFFLLWRRRKDDGAEPEVDPERDQRTVFAFQVDFLIKCSTVLV